ncbi:protein TIC 100 [Nymphaea colorata]|nr:protein TIC 100 [Nymphaea colorata]
MADGEAKGSGEEPPLPWSGYEEDEESSDSDISWEGWDEEYDSEDAEDVAVARVREGKAVLQAKSPEERRKTTIRRFFRALDDPRVREREEEEDRYRIYPEDIFDFPNDPEKWREEDLQEYWRDAPLEMAQPGWDPVFADEEDWEAVVDELSAGRDPPIAPFYVPFRKYFPVIPDNHHDIATPKAVIEELDRIEEFLKWGSYIFPDGSSYEGTVWDDLAHGKGVYIAEQGLVRYEGEWLQNQMEGHGVVQVDIPQQEPLPGSKLDAKWRAQGKVMKRDFMDDEDRKWLEMDIEDSVRLANTEYDIPFYESNEWVRQFGKKPEKGRYRYSGQWKHGRAHGCGVYEVNERVTFGRFYFGNLTEDSWRCPPEIAMMHASIAEVAAAKARMFVYKPDGMVREERGPYGDPQHPYFYEEEDTWMAPGFINEFYEVPDLWKGYVEDVDQEREMWLNSFTKSPLRLPMPAELEHWWSKDEDPEFILVNKEPEPDPEDPAKLVHTDDPLILHTPSGRFINFVDDEKYGVRLFWQPEVGDEDEIDPENAKFLPLGFDEFYGRTTVVRKKSKLLGFVQAAERFIKPAMNVLEKWCEEQKKACEMRLKLIDQELELKEAEVCLKEAIEEMEKELELEQKEEEKKAAMRSKEVKEDFSPTVVEGDAEIEAEEEESAEEVPWSFGSVSQDQPEREREEADKGKKHGNPFPFASFSTSLTSCNLSFAVPWKKGWLASPKKFAASPHDVSRSPSEPVNTTSLSFAWSRNVNIKACCGKTKIGQREKKFHQLHSLAQTLIGRKMAQAKAEPAPDCHLLCLQVPL